LYGFSSYSVFNFTINVSSLAIDALIVGIETQDSYLSKKKSWTRKIIIITDGENPLEIEDWEATVKKMNALDVGLTIVLVVFLSTLLVTNSLKWNRFRRRRIPLPPGK
jgi:hypothetical protein